MGLRVDFFAEQFADRLRPMERRCVLLGRIGFRGSAPTPGRNAGSSCRAGSGFYITPDCSRAAMRSAS